MITTTVCDEGRHAECEGQGLAQGRMKPPHEPEAVGEIVWVTLSCDCPCHMVASVIEESLPGSTEAE